MSSNQWRVCDPRRPDNDAQHLLGFIEITKDLEFEVMSLIRGFEWFTYPTLLEASVHFARAAQHESSTDRGGPVFSDAVSIPMVE